MNSTLFIKRKIFMNFFLTIVLITIPLHISAQLIVINSFVTKNRSWNDELTAPYTKKIRNSNGRMTFQFTTQAGQVTEMTKMLVHEQETLRDINSLFKIQESNFNFFIKETCTRFIASKYPIVQINPLNGLQMNPLIGLQNGITRLRFHRKFTSESDALSFYLNSKNSMSEAKRVYFVLDILENVTNIALENEKY
jgi:hypothetical protein